MIRLVIVPCLLFAACQTTPPDYRFELDGKAVPGDFVAIEGDGTYPSPGDVLTWPELVLDDVANQVFERRDGRTYRRDGDIEQLVAIQVYKVEDLSSLTDAEIAGLRGIDFGSWDPAMAASLGRVDVQRCLLSFGPLTDPIDLTALPAATRYLDMHYAEPVEPSGFARFADLRYLLLPNDPWVDPEEPPPPPPSPDDDDPGPGTPLDWIDALPELRFLDVCAVGKDLRPLAGHPNLRTVTAAHCRITHLPEAPMPALRELRLAFSDCPEPAVERMRRSHPDARIQRTPGDVLQHRVRDAVRLTLRTGSSCHPQPTDKVLYTTSDRDEIEALVELLQSRMGYSPSWMVPGCDDGVMEFFAADGKQLAEVGMLGRSSLRCYEAWSTMPAFLESEQSKQLRAWLVARGLTFRE